MMMSQQSLEESVFRSSLQTSLLVEDETVKQEKLNLSDSENQRSLQDCCYLVLLTSEAADGA